ncbi:hypothetical protein [uncultured Psychroserpens sp.]|uniref:hypothetical protein n=1 Tax=uncultured Psychroserpens sp. TaxID=255436 RepID=UPI00260A6927|nr:hypothetical protein [uncultured Psychroserpens sp.]
MKHQLTITILLCHLFFACNTDAKQSEAQITIDNIREKSDNLYDKFENKKIPLTGGKLNCQPCDILFLSNINSTIKPITQPARRSFNIKRDTDYIKNLLCIYKSKCDTNIEFVQYFNETLFRTMEIRPLITIQQILRLDDKTKGLIIKTLKNPIQENNSIYNIEKTLSQIPLRGQDQKITFEFMRQFKN